MISRRHHNVPQFYLKQWYVPGQQQLIRYYKNNKNDLVEEYISAKSTSFTYNQNTIHQTPFINKKQDSDDIEQYLANRIDSPAAKVLKKIIDVGKNGIEKSEIEIWANFIQSLIYRNSEHYWKNIESAKEIRNELLKEYRDQTGDDQQLLLHFKRAEELFTEKDVTNQYKITNFKMMLQSEFAKAIENAFWINTRINAGILLITSDQPVIINIGESANPISIINFPLSPNTLQSIYFVKDADINEHLKMAAELIILTNLKMILEKPRYIYSSTVLSDDGIIKYRSTMEKYLKQN